MTRTRQKVPIASTIEPGEVAAEQAADFGGAVVGGAPLVEQQALGQSSAPSTPPESWASM